MAAAGRTPRPAEKLLAGSVKSAGSTGASWKRRRAALILQDAVTRLQIVLEAGLPTEAYDSLVSLDLSKFRHGPLHYDQHRGAWRSELDE